VITETERGSIDTPMGDPKFKAHTETKRPPSEDGGPLPRSGVPDGSGSDPEVMQAMAAAWQDGSWSKYDGRWTRQLAASLSAWYQGAEVYLCCSGTIAVELALRGVGVSPRDEVILAGYDFPGNFRAVESIGASPVLVDLLPDTWTMDPGEVRAAIGPDVRAVIVSHLHGDVARVRELIDICHPLGIAVVEDVCQCPGATRGHQPVGSIGDAAVWSFGGSKLLTAGRGGAVVSRRPEVMQRIRVYSERGNQAFPMSELQACVLGPQWNALAERNRQRARAVQFLTEQLSELDCLNRSVSEAGVDIAPAFYKLGWFCGRGHERPVDRDAFSMAARAEGVALDPGFRGFATRSSRRCRKVSELAQSRRASEQTLLLHHPVLLGSNAELRQVVTAIQKVVRGLQSGRYA